MGDKGDKKEEKKEKKNNVPVMMKRKKSKGPANAVKIPQGMRLLYL